MEYVNLVGTEDMNHAANTFSNAVDKMQRVVNQLDALFVRFIQYVEIEEQKRRENIE
jgi:hypothetical protein